jgi:hypothetical protein
MKQLVQQGKALPPQPGSDSTGRFNIENAADLDNAILAVGRVRPNTDAQRAKVRRFIAMRAKVIGLSSKIPGTWNADGSLKPGASNS